MELPDHGLWPRLPVGYSIGCRQPSAAGQPKLIVYVSRGLAADKERHRRHVESALRGELPPDLVAWHAFDVEPTQEQILSMMSELKERAGL